MSEVDPVEVLRYARDVVLSDESKWCKGESSIVRDAGERQFCIIGAVDRADEELGVSTYVDDLIAAVLPEGSKSIPAFNDAADTTFSDVIDLFDKAIKKAEEA